MVSIATHPPTNGRSGRIVVGLMFAFSLISYFDRTIISISGKTLMTEFGLSEKQMGQVFSAFVFGYALAMIPGGRLADRIGARWTLTLMGLFSALFTGLTALAGSSFLSAGLGVAAVLIAIRFAFGMVTAPLYPACARMSAGWVPLVYHGRVQGLIIAGSSLGAAVSPLLFSWLLLQYGWRHSFWLAAAATGALALVWHWAVRDADHEPSAQAKPGSWSKLFANRNLLLLTFAYATLGYFQYIFFFWIYYYFGEIRHLGAAQSARYTAILFLTEGILMPLGGWISDRLTKTHGPRLGRRAVPIVGLAGGAAFLFAGTLVTEPVLVVACLSLASGLGAFCEGPFWAAVTEIGGRNAGSAGSILNTGAQIGGFFAPLVTPLIAAYAGWSWALWAGCLCVLLGAVACWLSDPAQGVGDA